ncbi:hypothetical protein V8V91_01910 [Algoriphagus halophilus]|uniref:SMP-30/gluconolactonase/LRE family protein n=1 Tax=Algoriphagus halophilus TaxID=226505 RepID=UPI0035900FC1
MNPIKHTLILAALLASNTLMAQIEDRGGVVARNAELVKVKDGFTFTEGPAVNRMGDIFFTDQPNNKIYKWSAGSNEITLFKENAGRSNGMYFLLNNTLITCADEKMNFGQ